MSVEMKCARCWQRYNEDQSTRLAKAGQVFAVGVENRTGRQPGGWERFVRRNRREEPAGLEHGKRHPRWTDNA